MRGSMWARAIQAQRVTDKDRLEDGITVDLTWWNPTGEPPMRDPEIGQLTTQ